MITVYNNRPAPVYLHGCNPYLLERYESGHWVDRLVKQCVREGEAIAVPAAGHREFEFTIPDAADVGGRYRVKVPIWFSCEEPPSPQPISRMTCEDWGRMYSQEFTIAK